jgi:hypothetical protein
VWEQARSNTGVDLVRFGDSFFMAVTESEGSVSHSGAIRVLASKDGVRWNDQGVLKSDTPGRGVYNPRFSVYPDGQLALAVHGIIPTPNSPDPIPQFGGTIQTRVWSTRDGVTFGALESVGVMNQPFGRVAWNQGRALAYSNGCICGNTTTLFFHTSADGKAFKEVYEHTLEKRMPEEGSVVFDGETAHCLVACRRIYALNDQDIQPGNPPTLGLVGTAKAPYTNWTWVDTNVVLSNPNVIRLPNGKIWAAVSLHEPKKRTALCELDPKTGKLVEILELPTNGELVDVGLSMHDNHLWAAFHKTVEGKSRAHVCKIALP